MYTIYRTGEIACRSDVARSSQTVSTWVEALEIALPLVRRERDKKEQIQRRAIAVLEAYSSEYAQMVKDWVYSREYRLHNPHRTFTTGIAIAAERDRLAILGDEITALGRVSTDGRMLSSERGPKDRVMFYVSIALGLNPYPDSWIDDDRIQDYSLYAVECAEAITAE